MGRMPTYPPENFVPEEEYLIREHQAEYKSEYRNGRVVAMSGSSMAHVVIKDNLFLSVRLRLKGKSCQAYGTDMRVKVEKAKFYTYPDLTVVCGKLHLDGRETATLANPTVIFEVLSPSTAQYDRGEKFEYYKKLASLREYVLVSQNKVKVEHFILENNRWSLTELEGAGTVLKLGTIDCSIPWAEIYENVDFEGKS